MPSVKRQGNSDDETVTPFPLETTTRDTNSDPTSTSDDPSQSTSSSSSNDDPQPTSSSSSDDDPQPTSSSSSDDDPPPTSSSSSSDPPTSSSSSDDPEPTSSSGGGGGQPTSSSSSSNDPDPTSSSSSGDPDPDPTSSSPSSNDPDPTSSSPSTDDPGPTSSSTGDPDPTSDDSGATSSSSSDADPVLPTDSSTEETTTSSDTAPNPTETEPTVTETTTTAEEPTTTDPSQQTETQPVGDTLSPTSTETGPDGLPIFTGSSSDSLSFSFPIGSLSDAGSLSLSVPIDSLSVTTTSSDSSGITSMPIGVSSFETTIDGTITTIMVTSWVIMSNGQAVTVTQTLPIGVRAASNGNRMNGGAIIGTAVGGAAALLLLGLVAFMVWRRSHQRIATSHRLLAGHPENMSQRPRGFDLAGGAAGTRASGFRAVGRNPNDPFSHNDDDDALLFPDAGSPTSAVMSLGPAAGPLLRPRGSETGSIFHETGIWPEPGSRSRMRDPIRSASEVELGGIVDDVMGRPASPNTGTTRLRGGLGTPGDPFMDYTSPVGSQVFIPSHNRVSSGSSFSGVTMPLLAAAASTPYGAARPDSPASAFSAPMGRGMAAGYGTPPRSRLGLVSVSNAGPSANPFADAKAIEATTHFRSGRSNASSADGHLTLSEGGHHMSDAGHSAGHPSMAAIPSGPIVADLVDLTPGQEAEFAMPAELPPQYHTIRRDSDEQRSAESSRR